MKTKHNEEFVYQAVMSGDLEIAEDGTIWRVRKRGWDRWQLKIVSRPCKRVRAEHDCGQYYQVRIMVDKIRIYALAHRLVWRHFQGPIPGDMTVNHKDGMKKRNIPSNLELATHREQILHALHILKKGRIDQNGEKNAMAKLTEPQVMEIRRRCSQGEKLKSIAADYPVNFKAISKICRGDRWVKSPLLS